MIQIETDRRPTHRIWLCIRFAKWAYDRLTENADFGKKKISFSNETHFHLSGYVNKQNCRIWGTENIHTLKSRRIQMESRFGADFGLEA